MGATKQTAKTISALIAARIEDTALSEQIAEIVKPSEGKTISKRIATAIEKALPAHTVYWNTDYGMFHVSIWGNGIEYNDRKRYLVGYHSGSGTTFSHARFLEHNACHLAAAIARNSRRDALLADKATLEATASAINRLNQARTDLAELTKYPNPDSSALQELAEGQP